VEKAALEGLPQLFTDERKSLDAIRTGYEKQIQDLYVVSWAMDQTLEIDFVLKAVKQALMQSTPVILNSDQGSQFTSPQYIQLLQDAGIKISMDGKGRAIDNIFTERLWRSLKYEEVYLNEYTSPRQARQRVGDYLDFYNHRRPHQSLDYRTPAEVYQFQ
jgi:putative transposase